jgi:hypothetical protein
VGAHQSYLFVTTAVGGASNYGTVVSLAPEESSGWGEWDEQSTYRFRGTPDGANPYGAVIKAEVAFFDGHLVIDVRSKLVDVPLQIIFDLHLKGVAFVREAVATIAERGRSIAQRGVAISSTSLERAGRRY